MVTNIETAEFDIDSSNRTKNDIAWDLLFKNHPILDKIKRDGVYEVSSKVFNEECMREARLMASIDSSKKIPSILDKNNLFILPYKTRGKYVIGHFDAFKNISYAEIKEERIATERVFDTLNPFNLKKESSMILTAHNYGILSSIASGQELVMTNFGRESTSGFEFTIDNLSDKTNPYHLSVESSQLEMDGVFESDDYVINIEAKKSQRLDFLTRQLYYPYRLLYEQTEKEILNVFMTYSADGCLYTHVYSVRDPLNYNSFELVSATKHHLLKGISINQISEKVHGSTIVTDEKDHIFPQANSIQKVFDTLSIIQDAPGITDSDIAYQMAVADRQGSYYGNACEYLGLVRRTGGRPIQNYLTCAGEDFLRSDLITRKLRMIELISRHKIFNHFLLEYLDSGPPVKEDIARWIFDNNPKINKWKTAERRASTVKGWIDWVLDTADE